MRSVRSTWARGDESVDETEPARDAMLFDEENNPRIAQRACNLMTRIHDEEDRYSEERFADRCRMQPPGLLAGGDG